MLAGGMTHVTMYVVVFVSVTGTVTGLELMIVTVEVTGQVVVL